MTCQNIELTHSRLLELLDYCGESGVFRWRCSGRVAGCTTANGYEVVGLDGRLYLSHRLAWFYANGRWPAFSIDHEDGVKKNNRLANLREATKSQNANNSGARKTSKSGIKGVSFDKLTGKWRATITVDGKQRSLGRHQFIEDAAIAYMRAAKESHGAFMHRSSELGVTFYDLPERVA
jgi:hypothetical protein